MVSRSSSKRSSLYDSLPVLDSWYPPQQEQEEHQDGLIRSNTTSTTSSIINHKTSPVNSLERPSTEGRRSVSFSVDPPSIHYIDEDEYEPSEYSRRRSSFPPHHHHHHPHGGARIKSLAKRLFPKQFIINKVHVIPSTPS